MKQWFDSLRGCVVCVHVTAVHVAGQRSRDQRVTSMKKSVVQRLCVSWLCRVCTCHCCACCRSKESRPACDVYEEVCGTKALCIVAVSCVYMSLLCSLQVKGVATSV